MKRACNPETVVAYIYDELNTDEHRAFEQHMGSCKPCRDEVDALRRLRSGMIQDAVPSMPAEIDLPELHPAPASVLPLHQATWFRVVATVAAAVILVVLTARLVDLRVIVSDGAMTFRFGDAPTATPEPVETAPDLELLFAEFKAEQTQFVNGLTDSVRASQQKHFDQTLMAFQRYLDERRAEDLELIALSLDQMQQLNDSRFIETQYVISQLITQMNQELITINRR